MKTLQNLNKILAVLLLGTLLVFAAKRTVTFEVNGACGMCETRIEQTAKGIDGVKKADWSLDDHMLMLKFDDKKTSEIEVRKALAAVGHDNGDFRAPDDVYENLPACCHYERKDMKMMDQSMQMNSKSEQMNAMHEKHAKHEKHASMTTEKEQECSGTCSEEEKAACEQEE